MQKSEELTCQKEQWTHVTLGEKSLRDLNKQKLQTATTANKQERITSSDDESFGTETEIVMVKYNGKAAEDFDLCCPWGQRGIGIVIDQ